MPLIDVRASVSMPDEVIATKWALFWRQEFSQTWKKVGVFEGDDYTLPDMVVGVEYDIAVAIVDGDGNPQPERYWTIETLRPDGNTEAPPAPTNLTVVQDGEYLDLKWDDVSPKMRDFKQYEVRKGSSWADAVRIAYGSKLAKMRIKWETDGAQTYRVVTLDDYGKRSSEVTFAITVQALEGFVDGTTVDEDGGGFAGTKTDVEVSASKLQYKRWGDPATSITIAAQDWTFPCWGPLEGTYETAEQDLGSARNVRIELDLAADTDGDLWARPAEDLNVPLVLRPTAEDGTPIDATDEESYLAIGEAVPAGDERPIDIVVEIKADTVTPITTSYQRYIPGFYYGRYVRFRVRIRSWDRWRRPRISTLQLKERKRNLKDEGLVPVVGSPGPTTITFAAGFIDTATLTANWDGAGFVQVASISSTQATVRVFDDGGVELFTGNVYWIAAGT